MKTDRADHRLLLAINMSFRESKKKIKKLQSIDYQYSKRGLIFILL